VTIESKGELLLGTSCDWKKQKNHRNKFKKMMHDVTQDGSWLNIFAIHVYAKYICLFFEIIKTLKT